MKIKSSTGKIIEVPKEHEELIRKHIAENNHEAISQFANGGWIGNAVNKDHVGFCTPMTKSTCTPRRKAFARTMKKHHGFHKDGGSVYGLGGNIGSILGGGLGSFLAPGMGTILGEQLGNAIGSQFDDSSQPGLSTPPFRANSRGLYEEGGETGDTDIEVEGDGRQEGTEYQMNRGELLVNPNGKVIKNFVPGEPHSKGGFKTTEKQGLIIIPKKRSQEFMNRDTRERKQIIASLKSQQDDRMNKHLDALQGHGLIPEGVYFKNGGLIQEGIEIIHAPEMGGYFRKKVK